MKQLIKMIKCYFKGHNYFRHFSEHPFYANWFQCDRCSKCKWKPTKQQILNKQEKHKCENCGNTSYTKAPFTGDLICQSCRFYWREFTITNKSLKQ